MILDFKEVKRRALEFSKKHKDDHSENSHSQMFLHNFLNVFGIDTHDTGSFEKRVSIPNHTSPSYIDYFLEKKIIIEQKSKGGDLEKALKEQASLYHFHIGKDARPDHILVSDFENFILVNKNKNNERHEFKLNELVDNIHLFTFLNTNDSFHSKLEIKLSKDATEIMGHIYTRLKETKYKKEDTEELLTRLVYCLFADDTGIFEKDSFHKYIKNTKSEKEFGSSLSILFDTLSTSDEERQTTLDSDLKKFPYINGSLFDSRVASPSFDKKMYESLLKASTFDWSGISPAIFGSLFQSVMPSEERREEGAHYTSESNILKVIKPLFLDDLNKEFSKIVNSANKKIALKTFQEKLSKLKFLDPACGAGNFLIIAYREIRILELKIIDALQLENKRLDVKSLIKVNVDQFYGIEKNKFSAKIAEIALWMMDHIMNNKISKKYTIPYTRIPLKKHPNIRCDDALEIDWNDVINSNECSYIFGNPPFSGGKQMSLNQKKQMLRITKSGNLDYVTAWFFKSAKYVTENTPIGFVSTNSIAQGEQVSLLWNKLYEYGISISFAYTPFRWDSDASGKAQVIVIILGLSKNQHTNKYLYQTRNNNIEKTQHKFVLPYLIGSDIMLPMVSKTSDALNGLTKIALGTKPYDGGFLTLTDIEKKEFLKKEPNAEKWIKQFIDSKSFINNIKRWIFDLKDIPPNELKKLPLVLERVNSVREFRKNAKWFKTIMMASKPTLFLEAVIPTKPFLLIPIVSSSDRKYIPIAYLKPPIIPSNATMMVENASVSLFGLLTSNMHMVWLDKIGGKLKNDFRYSSRLIYNTFPVPDDYSSLEKHAQRILDIRSSYKESSLADLYDTLTMPPDLRKAHDDLDKIVERLYHKGTFRVKYQVNPDKFHIVSRSGKGLVCECVDNTEFKFDCEHIKVVLEMLKMVWGYCNETLRIMERVDLPLCKHCDSGNITKRGLRKTTKGNIQLFKCKDCSKRFSGNTGFEYTRYNESDITDALNLYCSGMSVRGISLHYKQKGIIVSHVSVYNWLKKYYPMTLKYADTIIPKVGDTFRADEAWMKIKGKMCYSFNTIDDATRFWLASEMATSKKHHDTDHIFNLTKKNAGKIPRNLITDKLPAYTRSAKCVFGKKINHIKDAGVNKVHKNNNTMERFNGTLRQRTKTTRGLKKMNTMVLDGMRVYYNYVRPHSGIANSTPSEQGKVMISGKDKWRTLIQNASHELMV